jgi:hypothetical protein
VVLYLILSALILGAVSPGEAALPIRGAPGAKDLSSRMFYPALITRTTFPPDTSQSFQADQRADSGVNKTRLGLVGGTLLGSMVVIHFYQQSGWWKDNRAPFHFQEDLVYGLSVDKIGHFYGAYLLGFLIERSVRWANVPDETALWIGSGGALLFQTYVEVEDGFSAWGFDRVDFASDVGGAAWPIGRHYVPFLRNFDLKLSYHPSDLLGNPGGVGFKGQKHLIIDDYEGQTFWMSVKIHNLLPESIREYWPPWLCLAAGYGARHVAGPDPHRILFLAPDLDMTKILPHDSALLSTLGEFLNFIHLPMPAFQFYPNAIVYVFYF